MKFYLSSLLFIFMMGNITIAQTNSEILLSDHLAYLENKYEFTFSLDADLIQGYTISHYDTSSTNVEGAIKQLSALVPFQFQNLDSKNILVLPVQPKDTSIHFSVSDKEQTPIPYVYVRIKDKPISSVSNSEGEINIKGEISPYDSVILDGFGFNKLTLPISKLKSNTPIELSQEINQLKETVIEGYIVSGINSIVNDHSIQIDQKDIAIIPGQTAGDVLQSISILPGVSSPNTKAGNIFLRGSTTDQTLVYFDNIPLYNKGHFFGTLSPFNQLAVDKVNVYRNGSHPRLGGRVGGTLEIKTSDELSDSILTSAGISMTDVMVFSKAPIIKDKLTVLISGRHSLPDDLNTPRQSAIKDYLGQDSPFEFKVNQNPEDTKITEDLLEYKDLNGKLIFINDSSNITTSFLYTTSYRNREFIEITDESNSIDYFGGENIGINTQWKEKWNRALSTNLSASFSNYNNLIEFIKTFDQENTESRERIFYTQITDLGLKLESRLFDKKDLNYIDFGYNLDIQNNLIDTKDPSPNGYVYFLIEDKSITNSLYIQYNIRSFNKLSLNLGSRATYFDRTNKVYFEPRIFSNYQFNKHLSLKGAFCMNNQYINQLIFFNFDDIAPENHNWAISGSDLPPVMSTQKVLGVLYSKNDWLFDIEAYQKKIKNILTKGGFNQENEREQTYGEANIKGIDFLIRKKIKHLSLWTSYSLGEVLWNFDIIGDTSFNAYYDQRHQINTGAVWKKNKISLSSNFKFVSGLPIMDILGTTRPQPGQDPVPVSIDYQGRYNWHHQLDISISYKTEPKHKQWTILWSASFSNIYNNKTLLDEQPLVGPSGTVFDIYTMGFSPNFQAVITF